MRSRDHLEQHSLLMILAAFAGHIGNYLYHSLSGRFLSIAEYGLLTATLGLLQIIALPLQAFSLSVAASVARNPGTAASLLHQWSRRFLRITPGLLILGLLFAHFREASLSVGVFLTVLLYCVLLLTLMGAILQGLQRFTWLSLRAGSLFLGRALILGVILLLGTRTAAGALSAHGLALLLTLLLSRRGLRPLPSPTSPPPEILRFTLLSFPALLGFSILMTADVVLAGLLWDEDIAGQFAQAAVPARMILWLPLPIATVLFPKLADRNAPHPRRTLRNALLYASLLIFPAWLFCVLFPWIPLHILYGPPLPGMDPAPWLRSLATAMAPLPLIHLLLQSEFTKKRVFLRILLPLAATVYLGSAFFFRPEPEHLIRLVTLLSWSLAGIAFLVPLLMHRVGALPGCNPPTDD